MFELTMKKFENLRSQIGISSWGGTRYMPMAFTEQGLAMLTRVLNSNCICSIICAGGLLKISPQFLPQFSSIVFPTVCLGMEYFIKKPPAILSLTHLHKLVLS